MSISSDNNILYSDRSAPQIQKRRRFELISMYVGLIALFGVYLFLLIIPNLLKGNLSKMFIFLNIIGGIFALLIMYWMFIKPRKKSLKFGLVLTPTHLNYYGKKIPITNISDVDIKSRGGYSCLEINLVEHKWNSIDIWKKDTTDIHKLSRKIKQVIRELNKRSY